MGDLAKKRVTARGVVVDNGRVLLMERWNTGQHYFSIPGGGVEPGETLEVAAQREIEEEAGIRVKIDRKIYEVDMEDSVHHIYLCRFISGSPELQQHSEEAHQQWSGNRFEPKWVQVSQVESLPFAYWQIIKDRLVHDLNHGFANEVLKAKS